jgi:hypothetical protein
VLDVGLEEVGTFDAVLEDDERLVSYGIGPDGDALALAVRAADADAPFAHDEQPGWATFPKPRAEQAYTASVVRLSASRAERIALGAVATTFPKLQPLPNGEILLVGTRSARRPDGSHDLNASVFGPDGSHRREFLLGDGIEDVQATDDGHIWVSYFDEGIFGNFGWGGPDGPPPVGAAGLIQWRSDGAVEWEYKPPPGVDEIADCCALNVSNDAVWACYYTEFPLVRIGRDDVAWWASPIQGACALAITDGFAAFYGGYRDEKHRCVLLEFDGAELTEQALIKLSLPSGTQLADQPVIGRGSFLHVFDGPHWYQVDVAAMRDV